MSANSMPQGQQWHQYPMFMSAREIMGTYQPLDADRNTVHRTDRDGFKSRSMEDDREVWNRKLAESHDVDQRKPTGGWESLADSIKREGIHNPISLQFHEHSGYSGRPQVLGGHHRAATAYHYRPDDLAPVEHFDRIEDALRSLGRERY